MALPPRPAYDRQEHYNRLLQINGRAERQRAHMAPPRLIDRIVEHFNRVENKSNVSHRDIRAAVREHFDDEARLEAKMNDLTIRHICAGEGRSARKAWEARHGYLHIPPLRVDSRGEKTTIDDLRRAESAQMRAELRLRPRADPTRYWSVTVAPGVREWLAHWNARLGQTIATADDCGICMVEILRNRAARCPTCKQDAFHTACRMRWPSCPLCRRPDVFHAPWTFREFLRADGFEHDYGAFVLFGM